MKLNAGRKFVRNNKLNDKPYKSVYEFSAEQ